MVPFKSYTWDNNNLRHKIFFVVNLVQPTNRSLEDIRVTKRYMNKIVSNSSYNYRNWLTSKVKRLLKIVNNEVHKTSRL